MGKIAGKAFLLKVSTSDSGYTAALGFNDGTINLSGTNIDVAEFGDTWVERLQALKDASYDVKGFYNAADSTGQTVIQSAFLNDTALWVQFLPTGTTGFKQQVKVSKYSVGAPVNGVVSCDVTLEGTGAAALV